MADSLLAALEELNEQELRASEYASDAVLVIDNDLRTIAVPSNFIFGVYNDKNVLSVNFEMPRTYDDVDLSGFTIQINYLAPNKVGNVYEVTDPVVGEDKITFEWLLDRGVFLSSGTVEFTVCLREIGQEGAIIREFNTTIAKGTVLAGLEIEDPEDPEAYSLLAHIKQMDERVTSQAATVASDYAKTARIADDVEAIAEELADDVTEVKEKYGTPLVAATAAGMIDQTKIYVYTGSETGYTFGNWYYWDGTAWTSGGVYNSAGVNTDATLSVSGMPADAKKTGDEISGLKEDLDYTDSLISGIEIDEYESTQWKVVPLNPYLSGSAFVYVRNNRINITQSPSYKYYTVPTDGMKRVKVYAFSGSTIKPVVFADDNDNLISYYPIEDTPSPGITITVICNVPSTATKMYITQSASVNAVLYNNVIQFSMSDTLIDAISNANSVMSMQIEGYSKEKASIDGATKDGYVRLGQNGSEYALANWEYFTADCSEYKKLYISGYSGANVSLCLFADENDNIVYYHPFPSGNTSYENVELYVPAGAKKVYVNGNSRYTSASAKYEKLSFVKSGEDATVGREISDGVWLVGNGKMTTLVSLDGSSNGGFNYTNIQYDSEVFKNAGDDISPINLVGVGYIGGNHGYNFIYVATLDSHGLTVADIGKTCVVDGNTWVLLKVDSTSKFTVACLNSDVWYGVKTVATPPTTFNFGRSVTVTSISSATQLYPSIRDKMVKIVENTKSLFAVAEEYNVIDLKSGIDAIIANVGSNDNDSIVNRAGNIMAVRNLYIFTPESACVIMQNLKMYNNQAKLNFYGGTQSMGFGNSDYFAVPMTNKDTFSATGQSTDFVKTTWQDTAKPPEIYLQIDNTEDDATKMMLQGFVIADRNNMINTSAGFVYTSRKMYPYAIQPSSTFSADHTFDIISYRIPMKAYDVSTNVKFVGYCKINSDWYLFCYNPSSVSATVTLPGELLGKTVETLIAKNATCLNGLTVTGVDIKITGSGYILMKLT